jgi:ABC-type multidrug transport system permease subunit
MIYKKITKYNLLIIIITFLQITTCNAIIKTQQNLATTENKAHESNNEYIATEYSPLLSNYNIIINYNTITGDNKKDINSTFYLNNSLNKKNIYHVFLIFSTILLFFIGLSLLSLKYTEGFFVLLAGLFNVLILRKCAKCIPSETAEPLE